MGRIAAPGATLRLVEMRQVRGRLAGHVRIDDRDPIINFASVASLSADLPPGDPPRGFMSPCAWFKSLNRFDFIGHAATALNLVAGLALAVMLVTNPRQRAGAPLPAHGLGV